MYILYVFVIIYLVLASYTIDVTDTLPSLVFELRVKQRIYLDLNRGHFYQQKCCLIDLQLFIWVKFSAFIDTAHFVS